MFSIFKACLEFVQLLRDVGVAYSRHSRTFVIMTLGKIRGKSNFAQFGIECAYRQLYKHIQGITVYIQTPTHWNLIYRSMAGPPFTLSPSSVLPSHSYHDIFTPARKNTGRVSELLYFFFTLLKLYSLKLRKWGSACTLFRRLQVKRGAHFFRRNLLSHTHSYGADPVAVSRNFRKQDYDAFLDMTSWCQVCGNSISEERGATTFRIPPPLQNRKLEERSFSVTSLPVNQITGHHIP
jgi:hypothetical protein